MFNILSNYKTPLREFCCCYCSKLSLLIVYYKHTPHQTIYIEAQAYTVKINTLKLEVFVITVARL